MDDGRDRSSERPLPTIATGSISERHRGQTSPLVTDKTNNNHNAYQPAGKGLYSFAAQPTANPSIQLGSESPLAGLSGDDGREDPGAVPHHVGVRETGLPKLRMGGRRTAVALKGGSDDVAKNDPLQA